MDPDEPPRKRHRLKLRAPTDANGASRDDGKPKHIIYHQSGYLAGLTGYGGDSSHNGNQQHTGYEAMDGVQSHTNEENAPATAGRGASSTQGQLNSGGSDPHVTAHAKETELTDFEIDALLRELPVEDLRLLKAVHADVGLSDQFGKDQRPLANASADPGVSPKHWKEARDEVHQTIGTDGEEAKLLKKVPDDYAAIDNEVTDYAAKQHNDLQWTEILELEAKCHGRIVDLTSHVACIIIHSKQYTNVSKLYPARCRNCLGIQPLTCPPKVVQRKAQPMWLPGHQPQLFDANNPVYELPDWDWVEDSEDESSQARVFLSLFHQRRNQRRNWRRKT